MMLPFISRVLLLLSFIDSKNYNEEELQKKIEMEKENGGEQKSEKEKGNERERERERERNLVNLKVSRSAERWSACDSPLAFDPDPSGACLIFHFQ